VIYGRKYKDVEKKLAEARGDAARGITYDAGTTTVGEHLERWLADSVRGTVRQRTYERYESIVRVHLVPALGRVKLKALTPVHVRGLYRDKMDSGLASRTVLHIHRTLSKALKQAADDGLIPRNAVGLVKPPRPRAEEIRPLDREQVRALLDATRGDRLEALYVVAVTAGLRRGELQGLRWEDVDLDAETLQVRRTLSEPKGGYVFEAPKSGKGRNIRLTQRAVVALKEHRRRQLEERMEHGALWQDHGLVFASGIGTPLLGGNLNRSFKAALRRARDTLPRSQAHVRHAATPTGREPQVRPGTLRARRHFPHPQRLLARAARHGGRRLRGDGRGARITPVVSRWCQKGPGTKPGLSFLRLFAGN
jgi:integrase